MSTTEHHLVVAGDNLTAIARQYGSTVELIRNANPRFVADNGVMRPAGPDDIRVGDTLHIPIPVAPVFVPAGYAEWKAGKRNFVNWSNLEVVHSETHLRAALAAGSARISVQANIALSGDIETDANDIELLGTQWPLVGGGAIKFRGTRILVDGISFRPQTGYNTDHLTFRNPTETQIFAVRANKFDHATDGCLDVIWNNGHDVYGTIESNTFTHTDKACLAHSNDDANEGGRYHLTFRGNRWYDCGQRHPLVRDCDLHSIDETITAYGAADGSGNGIQVGRNSNALIENLTATPRVKGSVAFSGATVTVPRMVVVRCTDNAKVKVVNPTLHGGAQITEQNPNLVTPPPYMVVPFL